MPADALPEAEARDEDPNYLYIYALIRSDLEMPVGKLAAQAGHAFTDALQAALDGDRARADGYRRGSGGSKVVLKAPRVEHLAKAAAAAAQAGIPHALVTDSGHVLLPHFDGSPIITALGIGPCTRAEARPFLKKFRCA